MNGKTKNAITKEVIDPITFVLTSPLYIMQTKPRVLSAQRGKSV